jgi:hypothetical protein
MSSVVYFVERESDRAVKIGVTKNLHTRLGELRRQHGRIKLLGIIKGGLVREKILHWVFEGARLDGEFFAPDDELLGLIGKYAAVPEKKRVNPLMDSVAEVAVYRPKLSGEARDALASLAESLGFFAYQPGGHYGNPSPGQLIDALAAAYQADPTVVTECLRQAGVVGDGPPPPI